ncbi:MAG: carbohydrate kinase family protein [Chloroflexi bacterium]|nr:carbohydrate kinase family protein [Chloroflexota bacterium]MBU1746048.1 carbohydrate kinase family protein [Chloroflexota bacterium]
MTIVVTGSLAFDYIVQFPGYFKDHIFPDKLHMLSVSFLADSMKKLRGGCAANIAYNLALVNERPRIMGTVGEDFGEYRVWLEAQGVDTSGIAVVPDELTATCFITTDQNNGQFTGFYAGAMAHAQDIALRDQPDWQDIDVVIISPNDPTAMIQYARECRELGIPYIYDPGQQIIRLSGDELADGVTGSRLLILNEYELEMVKNKTGLTDEQVLARTGMLIVTRGEAGSTVYADGAVYDIPIAAPRRVADPTGAGDAYRAGIIKGLVHGLSPAVTGRLGSLTAAYAVEQYGNQEHHYTLDEFMTRFQENFGLEAGLRDTLARQRPNAHAR